MSVILDVQSSQVQVYIQVGACMHNVRNRYKCIDVTWV